jgi:DNA polymerase-3 subunit gamma/tau
VPYQVIARKWRPQKFDDVVGQQAVTRTLRNALKSGRLAQAFVFAGPRGVGKTTTARILARALNCVHGPTADPCGVCDPCVEIAEGRDMDVLEIDAATHTQVDNVREVIIAGLGVLPVRDRYKVFIIDEVHQLSSSSFNALLKSIEEPPPHVVFMMATTELEKIPETVLSRSQVYEFRTIGTTAIAAQLGRIVDAEGIEASDEALQLIARDAEGSMRDAQSKLDQVIAFTGKTVSVEDVSAVLGLVGRDLLLDAVQAVAEENAPAAFALAGRAVEMGYDLRLVVRELSRVTRDLLVLSVDPSRAADPEIAGEGERDRLLQLAARFSREDLLRAFDLLTRAETDIRGAAQPRYHLEMALLRWIYLRKLVPIEDLIQSTDVASGPSSPVGSGSSRTPPASAPSALPRTAPAPTTGPRSSAFSPSLAQTAARAAAKVAEPTRTDVASGPSTGSGPSRAESRDGPNRPPPAPAPAANLKDALLSEIRSSNAMMYNALVAQAQRMHIEGDRIVLAFAAVQKIGPTFDKYKPALEAIAGRLAGRRITVAAEIAEAADSAGEPAAAAAAESDRKKTALREQALGDPGVQALLEVFPAEIRDVEEM